VEAVALKKTLSAKIAREIPLWRKLVEDSGAKLDT